MTSPTVLRAAILIISDTAYKDASTDKSYPILRDVFKEQTNVQWEVATPQYLADDKDGIQSTISLLCTYDAKLSKNDEQDPQKTNLIVTTGGTGFATKDVTPEAIEPMLERKASGLV